MFQGQTQKKTVSKKISNKVGGYCALSEILILCRRVKERRARDLLGLPGDLEDQ